MKRLTLGLTAAIAVVSPAFAQAMSPSEYVAAAGAGDLYERTSSKIVLDSTRNAQLRNFAQMMIEQHTQSTADVVRAAKQARLTPKPPKLNAAQQRMIAQLRAASGTARDAAYIAQQKTAHDQALAIHSSYATNGTAAPLKAAAAKITPVVQQHIAMLQRM